MKKETGRKGKNGGQKKNGDGERTVRKEEKMGDHKKIE
jgi:hypothetical protein